MMFRDIKILIIYNYNDMTKMHKAVRKNKQLSNNFDSCLFRLYKKWGFFSARFFIYQFKKAFYLMKINDSREPYLYAFPTHVELILFGDFSIVYINLRADKLHVIS